MVKNTSLRKYVWIELGIWFVILCFFVAGVKLYQHKRSKELKTYQIFMPDVDGMIVGSPVKFMGVQVGYIQKVHIVSNNVYVKFVVTEKDTYIPEGAIATVEFNGLGGSKSLEIYPPTKESIDSKKLIVVNSPKRLHSSLALLNDMFDTLGRIGTRCSFFMNELGFIRSKAEDITPKKIDDEIDYANKMLDNAEKNRSGFSKKLKEWKR